MHADIAVIITLQDLDQKILELEKEVAALPRQIAGIEKLLDTHTRRLEADRAALTANQRDRKKLEGEIQVQEQKVSKLKDQMLLAKTNEQYRAFQHEIAYCEEQIRKFEDKILELMGESEPLERNVRSAEAALKQERAVVEAEKKRAEERTAEDQRNLSLHRARRKEVAAQAGPQVVGTYERIRKRQRNGVAVAEAVDGRCAACQMALRPQFYQELKAGESIMQCETCGRILYYHPPEAFDHEIGAPAASQTPQA
jgi:hypothetical protein